MIEKIVEQSEVSAADQINSVINNLSDKISPAIEAIANNLGIATERVYSLLIRQSYVDGIYGIFIFLLFSVLFVLSMKYIIKHPEVWEEDYDWNSICLCVIISIIMAIVSGVTIIIQLFELKDYISAIINPEWHAIQKIINQIKVLK